MKFFLVIAFASLAFAAEIPMNEKEAMTVKHMFESQPEGSFDIVWETSNGIVGHIQGQPKAVDKEHTAVVQQGTYEYTAPDGTPIKTSFTADENGFVATGDHIPTPPPTPEYILKALDFIKEHPYKEAALA